MKMSMGGMNSRLDSAKGNISELEVIAIENVQTEAQ